MHYIPLMRLTPEGARDPKAIPQRIAEGIKGWEAVGGTMRSFHVTFGDDDYVAVGDGPSDEAAAAAAAAFALALAGTGGVTTTTSKGSPPRRSPRSPPPSRKRTPAAAPPGLGDRPNDRPRGRPGPVARPRGPAVEWRAEARHPVVDPLRSQRGSRGPRRPPRRKRWIRTNARR